jgi:glycerate 2-kinase
VLGLGGSATNDAGMGILAALDFRFGNDKQELLQASGENLFKIKDIIVPGSIPDITLEIACDVQNILYGKEGAAYLYAPQKGANEVQVKYLDNGLKNFAAVIKEKTGKDIATVPGTGAAGGIAAGLLPFFDVELKKGIQLIINASKIEGQLNDASLLITGEGRLDKQSSEGKVVGYIAALAKQHDIPCIAVCGQLDLDEDSINKLGLQKVIPIKDGMISTEEAITQAEDLLIKKIVEQLTGL